MPAAGEKVLVAQVVNGHHQSTHIDLGRGPKDHTLRVAKDQLAIGLDATHDLTRVGIENAIKGGRLSVRGDELHRLVTTHIEGIPVHDGLIGGLANDHGAVCRLDAGLSRDHLTPRRQHRLSPYSTNRRPDTHPQQRLEQEAGNRLGRGRVSAHVASQHRS